MRSDVIPLSTRYFATLPVAGQAEVLRGFPSDVTGTEEGEERGRRTTSGLVGKKNRSFGKTRFWDR